MLLQVEECELYMFLKNGQHYQILEFSIENVRHVFLVGFDEYFMILRRKVTPMFQQHTELPIAAVYFIILICSWTEMRHDIYTTSFPAKWKMWKISFLLPEAYFNWFFLYVF
ncbi:Uncharacterized protein BM_BM280 [Brugia malayi]|uniref:Bm280 n=1 Tax=Brugia malayi TaxID=6279 RepID=A0A0K0J7H9_BRUMA|nr:Uncharacterized protein BM_BM280 [Brugia malayi]CDP92442.1 Bm280 [Brugia malayi]VIO95555.1 Uncharacterized protein BM_BM280 [Brugia malayi]